MNSPAATATLDTRLRGSFRTRYLLELLGNSAQFPIANILLELLLEGPLHYIKAPDLYTILLAAIIQAWMLTRWQGRGATHVFIGNLIGPAVYTAIEASIEGAAFFAAPHHLAYWGFALGFALLGAYLEGHGRRFEAIAVVTRELLRASIVIVMYALFERAGSPARYGSASGFWSDHSHQFVVYATVLLGCTLGYARLTAIRYETALKATLARLRIYSEWLLGKRLLARSFADPDVLAVHRRERTLLFMDIRGFTAWSERHLPEEVLTMLDGYYACAEAALQRAEPTKVKLTADEVMAVFEQEPAALSAASDLRDAVAAYLHPHGIGAGIGMHRGTVVEGLLGTQVVRFYDVLGDAVNTAKRIEGAAGAGELLVSDALIPYLPEGLQAASSSTVALKGKSAGLTVHRLASAPRPTSPASRG